MRWNVEVIIGTYEGFLLGYKLDANDETTTLTQSFADKSHSGTIKCLDVQGKWIATGSTDDRICIYDMKIRKQSQILLTHDGTVNTLTFTPDGSHLLSGGDDRTMFAVRVSTWFAEAAWNEAHNGCAVTHISCHPSGKLALSLGSDLVLRTWNLIKGRVAYKTNLKSKSTTLGTMPDCLLFSPSGDFFTLSGQRVIEIWSIKTADVVRSKGTAAKPICVAWVKGDECLVGLENGTIIWLTVAEEAENKEVMVEAHNARVKAMSFREGVLVTASSSGEMKVWRVNVDDKKLKVIVATNIGCRPTCVGILGLDQFGADYLINKIEKINQEKPRSGMSAETKPREKGVVTVEYEDDETGMDSDDEGSHSDEDFKIALTDSSYTDDGQHSELEEALKIAGTDRSEEDEENIGASADGEEVEMSDSENDTADEAGPQTSSSRKKLKEKKASKRNLDKSTHEAVEKKRKPQRRNNEGRMQKKQKKESG